MRLVQTLVRFQIKSPSISMDWFTPEVWFPASLLWLALCVCSSYLKVCVGTYSTEGFWTDETWGKYFFPVHRPLYSLECPDIQSKDASCMHFGVENVEPTALIYLAIPEDGLISLLVHSVQIKLRKSLIGVDFHLEYCGLRENFPSGRSLDPNTLTLVPVFVLGPSMVYDLMPWSLRV